MKRLLKKVMRDFIYDKRRAVISLLAILIGMMSFGIIMFSYQIISRELVSTYDAINPASASIMVDRVDDELITLTNDFNDIASFEEKAYYELRVQIRKNKWKNLELFAAEDFSKLEMNKISSEDGSFWPKESEMLIERDSITVADSAIGETLTISLPDGSTKNLTISGIIADISVHPAIVHDTVYAYVSFDALAEIGLTSNKIDLLITGDKYDRDRILTISNEYIKMLEHNGYRVLSLYVSDTPGLSIHMDEYRAALVLLQIFSIVTFLFGCMIMSSLISSIISSQTRQIGILKGIGADTAKIMASYLIIFFSLIVLTVAGSLTFAALLSESFSSALLSIGNMHLNDASIPLYFYAIYCGLTLLVPMIVAIFPIRRGVRISVKDALNHYGVNADDKAIRLPGPKFVSRPVLLSLRNAVRRKKRFLLNVITLTIAGALFVSIVTSMISIQTTLSSNLYSWKFDYQFLTNTIFEEKELAEIMAKVPNVTGYEIWGGSSGMLVNDNGEIAKSYSILSPPTGSKMLEPDILEGRWITDEDINQIVVSHEFLISESGYEIGDTLALQIGNQVMHFIIVGSMKDFGVTSIYMSENGYEKYVPTANQYSNIKLSLDTSGSRRAVYRDTEQSLKDQGILILQSQSKNDLRNVLSGHYTVTLQTFLFIICMLVIVSGFGLAATMNVQTSERTKEIGIMKAMGANKKQITNIITSESILISLISWTASILLGIPLGILSVYIFGNIILETPLQFSVVSLLTSYAIWLLLTFVVRYYASRSCAKRISNMSVRDSLAFE